MASNNEIFDLLNKMYYEVQEIKSDMNIMRSDINGRLDKLGLKVDKVNVIIENDLKPKIEVLFDGHDQNAESIHKLINNTDILQNDVNDLNIRMLKNENNINKLIT